MRPTDDELVQRFGYHRPGPEAIAKHQSIRMGCLALARKLVDLCPEGRELSLALTALEEVGMRANQAIAMTQPLSE